MRQFAISGKLGALLKKILCCNYLCGKLAIERIELD